MDFCSELETKSRTLRESILNHPFIVGIGAGTLDVEKFKFYIRQDYIYLIDYSRVLSIASAKSPDLATMSWFAQLLNETLTTEMNLHRDYCAKFGISTEELERTIPAEATKAYTTYLLTKAYHQPFSQLASALLPCQWGYWEIGEHLSRIGLPLHAPLYTEWIQMYSSNEFKALGEWLRVVVNNLADQASFTQLQAMEKAYTDSIRYEYLFWEMSYTQGISQNL